MGTLVYNGTAEFTFDDRVLAHLQIVIGLKLRRREGFLMTWIDRTTGDEKLTTVWVDPSLSLLFRYSGTEMPQINKEWLILLTESSNSSAGLRLDDELRAEIREELPPGTAAKRRRRPPRSDDVSVS
ncbi:hypothetical protein [Diaminobutyricibacter sp. McL0608]|uniref:DUF7882 family protein n=1 Tax=Leifsonia sp. McL0608 TaxID=3143537 RepID=UPI0031F307AB